MGELGSCKLISNHYADYGLQDYGLQKAHMNIYIYIYFNRSSFIEITCPGSTAMKRMVRIAGKRDEEEIRRQARRGREIILAG